MQEATKGAKRGSIISGSSSKKDKKKDNKKDHHAPSPPTGGGGAKIHPANWAASWSCPSSLAPSTCATTPVLTPFPQLFYFSIF